MTAKQHLEKYVETPFRHTRIVDEDNAIIAMEAYAAQFRQMAENLWQLLDEIDTLSDICKPTEQDTKAEMSFYNNALSYAKKRFEIMKSDGHKLYTLVEFDELTKSESTEQQKITE